MVRRDQSGSPATGAPWWLLLTVPLVVLGVAASLGGLLDDRVYARETESWETQALGQDLANLVVLVGLAVAARSTYRGSLRGRLVWLGGMVAMAYSSTIYVFDVHFGPLFLVYVALFGLSLWALVGGFTTLDPDEVRHRLREAPGQRFASRFLVLVGGAFALMWLSEDLPASFDGAASDALAETGLFTNPVHVLDLAVFLPTMILAGVLLRRGRSWGSVLAPVVLVAMVAISAGIVSLSLVAAVRGDGAAIVVATVMAVLGVVQGVTAWLLLRPAQPSPRHPRASSAVRATAKTGGIGSAKPHQKTASTGSSTRAPTAPSR